MPNSTADELILWLEGRMGRAFVAWERAKLMEFLRRICFEFNL